MAQYIDQGWLASCIPAAWRIRLVQDAIRCTAAIISANANPHLSPQLVSHNAAGEIAERPASVLKELLEISFDAGATRIAIDMEQGRVRHLRVTNDGCGILKYELVLAFSRHVTRKIGALQNLARTESLDFRSGTLSGIASVLRLTLIACTQDEPTGRDVETEDDEL